MTQRRTGTRPATAADDGGDPAWNAVLRRAHSIPPRYRWRPGDRFRPARPGSGGRRAHAPGHPPPGGQAPGPAAPYVPRLGGPARAISPGRRPGVAAFEPASPPAALLPPASRRAAGRTAKAYELAWATPAEA